MDFLVKDALAGVAQNQVQTTDVGTANIQVWGCGGGGGNVVNWLYKKGVQGAEIIAVNTDKQHLDLLESDKKILIGKNLTRGLGCGGFPQKGTEAAKESLSEIKAIMRGADMVFITAGMGGGTGTGCAPVIAKQAKDEGAIVIGSVTMPFNIERARIEKAEYGLQQLRNVCDTVIVIDNNRLVQIAGNLPVQQAFAVANELVSTMIKGIVEIIAVPSLVNLDYADVKAIMSNGDVSVVGIGESNTERRVDEAVRRALENPLLEVSYTGATGALIHITGGQDLTLDEVSQAGEMITEALDSDANVIWGARIADDMKGKLRIMAIVTGVQSPYILGKVSSSQRVQKQSVMSRELGVDFCRTTY